MFGTLRKKRAHAHNMYTLNSACFFKKYIRKKFHMCKHAACASKSFNTIFFSLINFTSNSKDIIVFKFYSLIFSIMRKKGACATWSVGTPASYLRIHVQGGGYSFSPMKGLEGLGRIFEHILNRICLMSVDACF